MGKQPAGNGRQSLGPMQHAKAAPIGADHGQMPKPMLAEQGNGAPQAFFRGAGDQRRGHGGGKRRIWPKLEYNAARDILFGQNADGAARVIHHHQGRCPRRCHGGDGLCQGRFCGQRGRCRTHGSARRASQHGGGGMVGYGFTHGLV